MSKEPKTVILATHNPDKRQEILPLMAHLDVEIRTLDEYPQVGEIIEDGATLEENALIKARTVHRLTGEAAIADDTGLMVDALDGAPGVHTGRYAGENAGYEENVDKLLHALKFTPDEQRTARFGTMVAYVDSRGELIAEGVVEGTITRERKGVGGFGYDPVFYIPNLNRTFAEMTLTEKSKISHRGKAFRAMSVLLDKHLTAVSDQSQTSNNRS